MGGFGERWKTQLLAELEFSLNSLIQLLAELELSLNSPSLLQNSFTVEWLWIVYPFSAKCLRGLDR